MVSRKAPACPICDSTEYVLRQGEYFCRMCNTQSQELGMETIMDDETVPGGLQMCDQISVGSKGKKKSDKERKRRRAMLEAETWSTAELFSFVLRGWVLEMKKLGIDVEIAVLQLWSLYLRKLKMGFEKFGEEGCLNPGNLKKRDRVAIIGAAPGFAVNTQAFGMKRMKPNQTEDDTEDEDALSQSSLKIRRKLKKKRRDFFKTFSDAESVSEISNVSSSDISDSESELSEDGYITDASTVSQLLKRFNKILPSNTSSLRLDPKLRNSPEKLHIEQLAALFTLALVGRLGLNVMVEDVVRWFNHEVLSWLNSHKFIPDTVKGNNDNEFRGKRLMDTDWLSLKVWQMSSFLLENQQNVQIPLIYIRNLHATGVDKIPGTRHPSSNFKVILARVLEDLSLPSFLVKDIYRTFKHLHLLNLSSTVGPYVPDKKEWHTSKFPSVMTRLLSLILLALKFYFVLDDQYEFYQSHNIKVLRRWGKEEKKQFDILTWIRLSKLRLDYLMSRNHFIREQFKVLNHIGIPPLTKEGELEKMKMFYPQPPGYKKEPKFDEILSLFKDLTFNDESPNPKSKPNNSTFQPILDNTKFLLEDEDIRPEVQEGFRNLLEMPSQSLSVCFMIDKEKTRLSRGQVRVKFPLKTNYNSCFRKYSIKRKIVTKVQKMSKKDFLHNMFSTEFKRSNSEVVTFKTKNKKSVVESGDFWANVTKKYWFSGPTVRNQPSNNCLLTPTSRDHIEKNLVTTLPDSFAWILQYFASYAHVNSKELLQELADIENLILHLNQDYFGYFKGVKTPKRDKWSSKYIKDGVHQCPRCDFDFQGKKKLEDHIQHAHAPA